VMGPFVWAGAVARAGHDIRGPLCTARLALAGLEPCARVEAIDLELRRAALALDDLTAPRRGRRAVDCWESVDLGHLLAAAAPAWDALARRFGASLTVAGDARVAGDHLRLAQACANLVSNAIEHGGGRVDVSVTAASGRAGVHVVDGGDGLPVPLPRLLAAARGRRTTRGHGLAIAAGIAARHGGRLLEVPAQSGAHLVLDLPAS
jgi:signal transduction histidine kinase